LRIGPHSLEDLTVAADPDPYFALPKLYGAPAYARPPRVVDETERPFDPDDLPIAAARVSDEQTLEGAHFTIEAYQSVGTNLLLAAAAPAWLADGVVAEPSAGPDPVTGQAPSASASGSDGSRLRLRALTGRLGPRSK
jgi:hypothetical protein